MNRESRSRLKQSTSGGRHRLRRRRLLAAGTAAVVGGLAGCAGVANYLAEFALGELNLFNQTDSRLTGSIAVTDPAGSTTLEDRFEAEPEVDEDEDSEETEKSGVSYDDVLTDAGSYTVSVALDDDSAVDGETNVERRVEVADPAEEHIIVVFGADDFDGAMGAFVIEKFTDIGDYVDD